MYIIAMTIVVSASERLPADLIARWGAMESTYRSQEFEMREIQSDAKGTTLNDAIVCGGDGLTGARAFFELRGSSNLRDRTIFRQNGMFRVNESLESGYRLMEAHPGADARNKINPGRSMRIATLVGAVGPVQGVSFRELLARPTTRITGIEVLPSGETRFDISWTATSNDPIQGITRNGKCRVQLTRDSCVEKSDLAYDQAPAHRIIVWTYQGSIPGTKVPKPTLVRGSVYLTSGALDGVSEQRFTYVGPTRLSDRDFLPESYGLPANLLEVLASSAVADAYDHAWYRSPWLLLIPGALLIGFVVRRRWKSAAN